MIASEMLADLSIEAIPIAIEAERHRRFQHGPWPRDPGPVPRPQAGRGGFPAARRLESPRPAAQAVAGRRRRRPAPAQRLFEVQARVRFPARRVVPRVLATSHRRRHGRPGHLVGPGFDPSAPPKLWERFQSQDPGITADLIYALVVLADYGSRHKLTRAA